LRETPDLSAEERLWARGYTRVAGIDEAGRGAWAGPVVAAAVVLPAGVDDLCQSLDGVRDSKLLSPRQRDRCYDLIVASADAYAVGIAGPDVVDRLGIVPATRQAMRQAVRSLDARPDFLLIDAVRLYAVDIPQESPPKADLHYLSVAAASIIAKVTRDRLMVALGAEFPGYGLGQHKGYGTPQHRRALETFGATNHHRHSFAPIAKLEGSTDA